MENIQVVVAVCKCKLCTEFRKDCCRTDSQGFDFTEIGFDFGFQKLEDPDGVQPVDYGQLATILECRDPSPVVRKRNTAEIIRFVSYMDLENKSIGLYDLILISDHIYNEDFEAIIEEGTAAADFLMQIVRVFVISWYSVFERDMKAAEWIARKIRRFLTHILAVPIIAGKVASVFFMEENWPQVGPIKIIERMCKETLICMDTVSLICNLTRIDDVPEYLDKQSVYVKLIQQQFSSCCARIRQSEDELGGLLLMLFMNMSVLEGFLRFLIEKNNGYFMNIVLVDLMANSDSCEGPRSTVWPFLRNLSLREKGRQTIMENLELYLGHLLYPIAGPEKLAADETVNLPLELIDLPETKTRVQDKRIREYILDTIYSLCRYRKDRVLLRDADIYQILKHYHLAEDDPNLIIKIEDIVNIIIRHEGSEIEVDDLMAGLSINPGSAPIFPQAWKKSPPLRLVKELYWEPKPKPQKSWRIALDRIVPEDAEIFRGNLNPCTGELFSSEKKHFNYDRFSDFSRLRCLYFQAQRLQQKMLTKSNEKSVQSCPEPSEKFLKSKFVELYGPVDFENPQIQKLLKTMATSVMETALTPPDDPDIMLQLLDEDIDTLDPLLLASQLGSRISARYKAEEQLKYSKLNPVESKGDWFLLPRLPLKDLRKKYFPGYDDDDEKKAEDPAPLKNLHVYDPKSEFCYNLPYRIFKRDEELQFSIPRLLSCRLLEHLNSFPFGVSDATFWEKFVQKHKYTPNTSGWPDIRTLNALLHRHDNEMYLVQEPIHLNFPGTLEGFINPDIILRRLWHVIKCLLGKSPYLSTSQLLEQIKSRHGFEFDPLDWNFDNVNDFLRFLVDKFGCKNALQIYRLNYSENYEPRYHDYLIFELESVKKEIEKLHGGGGTVEEDPRTEKIHRQIIPKGFFRENSPIKSVSNEIISGSVMLASLKTIHDPEMLSLVLKDHLDEAWAFHFDLQECMMVSKFETEMVQKERFKLGMYVMAYMKWSTFGPFWFRVRVLWQEEKLEDTYMVFGVDFGFMEPVKMKDMRYMPRAEIGKRPAFAIIVGFAGVKHPSGVKSHRWEIKIVNRVLDRLMTDADYLKVRFVDAHYDSILGCKRWSILCDVVAVEVVEPGVESESIKHLDLVPLFYRDFCKELEQTRKKAKPSGKSEQRKVQKENNETPASG